MAAARNQAAAAASGDFGDPRRRRHLSAGSARGPRAAGDRASRPRRVDDGRIPRGERAGRKTCVHPFMDVSRRRSAERDTPPELVFGLAAVRREVLRAGGWDESLRFADWECWVRLLLDGSPVGCVVEPLRRGIACAKTACRPIMWPCSRERSGCWRRRSCIRASNRRRTSSHAGQSLGSGKSSRLTACARRCALGRSASGAARPRSRPTAPRRSRRASRPQRPRSLHVRSASSSIVAIGESGEGPAVRRCAPHHRYSCGRLPAERNRDDSHKGRGINRL